MEHLRAGGPGGTLHPGAHRARVCALRRGPVVGGEDGRGQGLTLVQFSAQLEDHREYIAPVRAQLEHLRATSTGYSGSYVGQSKLKLSGKGQSKLKLSGDGNEC